MCCAMLLSFLRVKLWRAGDGAFLAANSYLQKSLVVGGERCENYRAFKVKVADSLICPEPVLKQQLKGEEEEVMIEAINEPPSLSWKYKGKYMRCTSYAFILPINLKKCLWDHYKHY